MEVKPIVPLIQRVRLIRPENGIQVAAGIGPSGAVSFAMSILERYLGRGEYELDPAFLVFAQWAREQEEEEKRETEELKTQLTILMRMVHETRRERQLPSVSVQLLKQLEQTVFLCERQTVALPKEILMFCRELIREKHQIEMYLQKPEVALKLQNLLREKGKMSAEPRFPLISLSMERKIQSGRQLQNYVQRFAEMKKESVQVLHEVLTERRSLLELFEHLTPEERRGLERLLPEYFSEGSNPVQVLTTMNRQSWSRLKERIRILTEEDSVQTTPVTGEAKRILPSAYPVMGQFLQSEPLGQFFQSSQVVQKVYEAVRQTERVLSEKKNRENRLREAYVTRKEEYIRKIQQQTDQLPEEMEPIIGKAPLISLISEHQETAAFLTEFLYEIPELEVYRSSVTVSETAGKQEPSKLEVQKAELTEIIESLDAKEWKLLETRILQKAAETAPETNYETISGEWNSQYENQKMEQLISETAEKLYEAVMQIKNVQPEQMQLEELQLEQLQPGQMRSVLSMLSELEAAEPALSEKRELENRELENRFQETYRTRKEEYIRRIRQQTDHLSEEMAAVIGKAPLISLIKEQEETAAILTECLYEIPELEVYRSSVAVSESTGKQEISKLEIQKAELTEIIESLDAKEWKLLERRILRKTAEQTMSETVFREALKTVSKEAFEIVSEKVSKKAAELMSESVSVERESRNENQKTKQLISEIMERLQDSALQAGKQLKTKSIQREQIQTELVQTGQVKTRMTLSERRELENRFREAYVTRKKEYIRRIRQQTDRLPEEMEPVIGKEPLISLISESQESSAFLAECLYEIPELSVYTAKDAFSQAETQSETRNERLRELIERLDKREWKLLEKRILKETETKVQRRVEESAFLKTIREHMEEHFVISMTSSQNRVESVYEAEVRQILARNRSMTEMAVRNRAVMADSAITLKAGSTIREFLKEQTKTELCSYEFVLPDRVVVRPIPPRGTEPPAAAGQGDIIREISPEETRSLQTDILKIQRPEQQRLKGEYEQKLKELSDRLNQQKEALERLQETQHQLRDSRQPQKLINRMMKQLKGQIQLERLQRGTD